MSDTPYDEHFVSWFRAVTPYINAFRGKTFVIAFGGKAVQSEFAKTLAYDVNLLVSLGIRLVLVHGARPQIEEELREKSLPSNYHRGYRVTDAETLDCVLDAVGSVYLEIEAMLSQGSPNPPMANSHIRVIGGNFVTGQPMVDAEGIRAQLGLGNIVLLNCEGPSPTGEIFNLQMEEVAEAVAISLKADKLVFLTDSTGVSDDQGGLLDAMTADEVAKLLEKGDWLSPDIRRYLPSTLRARRAGVGRVHLIGFEQDGALLRELFTHDGVRTVITRESLESIREARPDDIGALVALIQPMEEECILVHRPRELLERKIELFSIVEHDGIIVGCAALYGHSDEEAELACLAVNPDHREWGYGEQLMRRIERRARKQGFKRLFVLTTRTEHWFVERGFTLGTVDDLPAQKRQMYNYQRRSKVLFQTL